MADNFNTIAGWTLFAGIVALGTTLVSGEYFGGEAHEGKGGYEVADSGGGGETAVAKPINYAAGDPAKGAELFNGKCTSCHSIASGGTNGIGPNLWAVMSRGRGKAAGFAYSGGVTAMGGSWDWASMDKWIASPKKFIDGTKMSYAGMSDPVERADLIRYINDQGSNLPVPAAPVEMAAAPAGDAKAAPEAAGNAAAPAADAKGAAPAK